MPIPKTHPNRKGTFGGATSSRPAEAARAGFPGVDSVDPGPHEPGPTGQATRYDLILQHCGQLSIFIQRRARGQAAEDAIQETVCRALAGNAVPGDPAGLQAWLRKTAGLVLLEHYRLSRLASRVDGLEMDAILATIEPSPGPDEVFESKEDASLLNAALSSLRPLYREVIVLRFVDCMSVAEVATRRGATQKATRSLLDRARNALRSQARLCGLLGLPPHAESEGSS